MAIKRDWKKCPSRRRKTKSAVERKRRSRERAEMRRSITRVVTTRKRDRDRDHAHGRELVARMMVAARNDLVTNTTALVDRDLVRPSVAAKTPLERSRRQTQHLGIKSINYTFYIYFYFLFPKIVPNLHFYQICYCCLFLLLLLLTTKIVSCHIKFGRIERPQTTLQ